MKKLSILFSLIAFTVTLLLSGCGDDELKLKVMAKITEAEQKLELAKSDGVDKWAPVKFNTAKLKLDSAKSLVADKQYQKAQLLLEDFHAILDEARLEALSAKEKAAKEVDLLAMERKKALAAEQARREAELEEEKRRQEETAKAKMFLTYEVEAGDCLWNIAKNTTQLNDPFKWTLIYMENKDKIDNPDLIFPGQVFKIPQITQ